MGGSREELAAWALPFSINDQMKIAALPPETRAIVERYRRATAWQIANNLTESAMAHGGTTSERMIEGETQYVLAHTV